MHKVHFINKKKKNKKKTHCALHENANATYTLYVLKIAGVNIMFHERLLFNLKRNLNYVLKLSV